VPESLFLSLPPGHRPDTIILMGVPKRWFGLEKWNDADVHIHPHACEFVSQNGDDAKMADKDHIAHYDRNRKTYREITRIIVSVWWSGYRNCEVCMCMC